MSLLALTCCSSVMSKEKRGDKLAEIVEDGLYIKSLLEKVPSEKLEDLEQLEIMETIFEENVKISRKEIVTM